MKYYLLFCGLALFMIFTPSLALRDLIIAHMLGMGALAADLGNALRDRRD